MPDTPKNIPVIDADQALIDAMKDWSTTGDYDCITGEIIKKDFDCLTGEEFDDDE